MSTNYAPLNNAATNLKALLQEQNVSGVNAAKLDGWEPFEVLAAKTIYNNYADIQANVNADVEGPASATDNALARFDGTTGKLIQNSNAILTDAGALTLVTNLTVSGTTDSSSKDTGAIVTEGGLGVEKSATIGGALTVNGAIISTLGNNTTIFNSASATTGYQVFNLQNTSGRLLFGLDASTGGTLITGSTAYATCLTTIGNKPVQIGVDQALIGSFSSTGLAITGALSSTGNLTVSGGTVTSGSGTLTLNSSANTVVLQSAGTTALTLDTSQTATFANQVKLGTGKILYFDGGINTYLQGSSGTLFIGTNGAATLTLDSSQNATFAGKVTVGSDVSFPAGGYGLLFGSTRVVEVVSDGINIVGSRIRISTDSTPASASAAGTKGDIKWDASYIYVCTATNTWKRAAIATW